MNIVQADIRKMITRNGKFIRYEGPRKKGIYAVACQGCGRTILNTTDEELGMCQTKRGTLIVWHARCQDKIGDNKLLWRVDT